MTDREKAIIYFKDMRKRFCEDYLNIFPKDSTAYKATLAEKDFYDTAIESLQQEPCEMTAEDYRQRMMQAFHNADCGELIAVCVLPTEKEFEHLEWLLKNHYKKEPCDDAVSREAVMHILDEVGGDFDSPREAVVPIDYIADMVSDLPSVSPQPKMGRWIDDKCSVCGKGIEDLIDSPEWYQNEIPKYCPFCGIKIQLSKRH